MDYATNVTGSRRISPRGKLLFGKQWQLSGCLSSATGDTHEENVSLTLCMYIHKELEMGVLKNGGVQKHLILALKVEGVSCGCCYFQLNL